MSVKPYSSLMNKRPNLTTQKLSSSDLYTMPRLKVFDKSPSQPDIYLQLTERIQVKSVEPQFIGSFHSSSEGKTDERIVNRKIKGKSSISSMTLNTNKLQDVFNSISDFNNRQQLLSALKSLDNAFQRVKLIDKILLRREEIKNAKDIIKIKKLNPLFTRIKKKIVPTPKVLEDSKVIKTSTSRVKSSEYDEDKDEERDKVEDNPTQMRQSHQIALKWVTERKNNQLIPPRPSLQEVISQHSDKKKLRKVSEVSEYLVRLAKEKEAQTYFKPRKSTQIQMVQSKVALLRQTTSIQ